MRTRCDYIFLVGGPIFLFVLLRHRYLPLVDLLDDRMSESSGKCLELRTANAFNPGINMFHVWFWNNFAVKWSLYTYDDLCTARMHIGIRKVFECVEPYDLGENYSAAWRARAKVASLFVAIIYDLSRDSRALLVQFSLFGVKCCRLIMYYSGSSRKRKSTSINLGMKISMGHSLRTYSSFHILMRCDTCTIFLITVMSRRL